MFLPADALSITKLNNVPSNSLVLKYEEYGSEDLLVVGSENRRGIVLEGEYKWFALDAGGNTSWGGLVIPDVRIEVDISSRVDAMTKSVRGSIVKKGGSVSILAFEEGRGFRTGTVIPITDGPPDADSLSVAFTRWQIVKGEGVLSKVLRLFDVTPKSSE